MTDMELKARTARSIADAEEMLELGADCPIEPSQVYLKSEVDKVIAELKEERRWRKCSDEKPELGDFVLVKFSERVKGHYFPMDVVRWDSTYELGEIEVSHWMPLPSAPKEEK